MENSREKCPQCGKKLKHLKKHIKRNHSSLENSGKIPDKVQEIPKKNSSFLKEINLQGEFETMTDKINPKSKDKKEDKYECGGCGKTFNVFGEGHVCPGCGVEL